MKNRKILFVNLLVLSFISSLASARFSFADKSSTAPTTSTAIGGQPIVVTNPPTNPIDTTTAAGIGTTTVTNPVATHLYPGKTQTSPTVSTAIGGTDISLTPVGATDLVGPGTENTIDTSGTTTNSVNTGAATTANGAAGVTGATGATGTTTTGSAIVGTTGVTGVATTGTQQAVINGVGTQPQQQQQPVIKTTGTLTGSSVIVSPTAVTVGTAITPVKTILPATTLTTTTGNITTPVPVTPAVVNTAATTTTSAPLTPATGTPVIPATTIPGTAPVTPSATTVATSPSVTTPPPSTADADACNDKVMQEIYALLEGDQYNILPKMFELTAMRLAERALEQNPDASTLEEVTKDKIKDLSGQIASEKTSGVFKDKVLGAYRKYGKATDADAVDSDFEHFQKKSQNSCYWSKNTRLANDDVSAYVLAVSASEPGSDLSEIDAATLWVVEKARKASEAADAHYKVGNLIVKGNAAETDKNGEGNLLNISTRVARYLGRIKGGKNVDKDTLKSMIKAEEQKITDAIAAISKDPKITAELQKCASLQLKAEGNDPSCVECTAKKVDSFVKSNLTLEKLEQGLLLSVSNSANLKMDHDLKMKLGTNTFDFSNFAKADAKDVIKSSPPRGKIDACGGSSQKINTPAPASVPAK